MDKVNETGKTYGRWEVIKFDHWRTEPLGKRVPYWLCKCNCGTERAVNIRNLHKGKSVSCGCYNREVVTHGSHHFRKPVGESSKRQLFCAYRTGAKNRNLLFEITFEEFGDLTSSDCHYCGIPPKQINKIKKLNGNYIYNGIDRADSSKGYVKDNCVPCCKLCNYAKRDVPLEDFLTWINRVIQYQKAVRVKPLSSQ